MVEVKNSLINSGIIFSFCFQMFFFQFLGAGNKKMLPPFIKKAFNYIITYTITNKDEHKISGVKAKFGNNF